MDDATTHNVGGTGDGTRIDVPAHHRVSIVVARAGIRRRRTSATHAFAAGCASSVAQGEKMRNQANVSLRKTQDVLR
jgi:hypothetical protein